MRFTVAQVERDEGTGLLVASVPGVAGAHTQAASMSELSGNLREVLALLREDEQHAIPWVALLWQEDELYVADAVDVGVASQGQTMEEAFANLSEATELYVEEFPQPGGESRLN